MEQTTKKQYKKEALGLFMWGVSIKLYKKGVMLHVSLADVSSAFVLTGRQ